MELPTLKQARSNFLDETSLDALTPLDESCLLTFSRRASNDYIRVDHTLLALAAPSCQSTDREAGTSGAERDDGTDRDIP